MTLSHARRALPLSLLVLLTACGGGGGSRNEASAAPRTVTFTTLDTVTWAACQDGDGAWKPVEVSSGKASFSVSDPAGRYGFAVMEGVQLSLWQATAQELPAIAFHTDPSQDYVNLQGTVTGFQAGEQKATVYLGTGMGEASPEAPAYGIFTAPGTRDLYLSVTGADFHPSRFKILRDLAITDSTALPPLDLGSGTFTCDTRPVTIEGLQPGEAGSYLVAFKTSHSTAEMVLGWSELTAATLDVPVVPASQRLASDLHLLEVDAVGYRRVTGYLDFGGAPTRLPLPAALADPAFSFPDGAAQPTVQWQPVGSATCHNLRFYQPSSGVYLDQFFTKGWLGGRTALTSTVPDFSTLPGWNSGWHFAHGSQLRVTLVAHGGNDGSIYGAPTRTPKAGDIVQENYFLGTYTPGVGFQAAPAARPAPGIRPF